MMQLEDIRNDQDLMNAIDWEMTPEEAVRLNAYTYLENPLDMDKLLATLEKLKRKQLSDSIKKSEESHG